MAKVIHFECGGEFDTEDTIIKGTFEYETGTEYIFDCPCCKKETHTLDCG